MFYTLVRISQIFTLLWWLIVILVAFTMFRGSGGISGILSRLKNSLTITWIILFLFWMTAQFGAEPVPSFFPEPANSLAFFGGLAVLLLWNGAGWFTRTWRGQKQLRRIQSLRQLKEMRPDHFEQLVATTYQQLGYRAKRVGKSGDHGVDVVLTTPLRHKWVVQCKRYRDSVGESYVRDLYGTMISEKAEKAILVTTAEITTPAETWARGKPIELVDGYAFLRLMQQARRVTVRNLFWRALLSLFSGGINDQTAMGKALVCPSCGSPLILHPLRPHPRPGQTLYRCTNYPNCRVVIAQTEPVENAQFPAQSPSS